VQPAAERPERMNIGCDARALVGERTGVGTWTERVMGGLARSGFGTVMLAASKTITLDPEERHPGLVVLPPPRVPLLGPLWLNSVLPATLRRLEADVWVGALAILPVRCPVPSVAMVHDLTPRTHPRRHTFANRLVFRFFLEPSLRSARVVVAGSSATAAEILAAFPWAEPKLEIIGYGVDEWYSPAPTDDDGGAVRRRFSEGRPYVLHLGTIEPRKGIPELVAAWERLVRDRDEGPDLVIAGREGWQTGAILDRVQASPLSARIHLTGYVSRHDARELLRHAAVFALASEVEGFGLPLAEAISCGTPAVATDIPALREAGGDAALYCPHGDTEAFAAALADALEPSTADRLRRLALERAPELRWDPVVDAWADLLGRLNPPNGFV
jgi:glycosyltransferase involved in cell wall biosynthesis